jgi:hypothetical protein
MGFVIFQEEPPTTKSDPQEPGIPTHLTSQMGVFGTSEAARNRESF